VWVPAAFFVDATHPARGSCNPILIGSTRRNASVNVQVCRWRLWRLRHQKILRTTEQYKTRVTLNRLKNRCQMDARLCQVMGMAAVWELDATCGCRICHLVLEGCNINTLSERSISSSANVVSATWFRKGPISLRSVKHLSVPLPLPMSSVLPKCIHLGLFVGENGAHNAAH
jgi:hypothetical protein